MPPDLTCPHCQRLIRPTAEQAGKVSACPHCGKEVRIPLGSGRSPLAPEADPRWKTPTAIWYVQAEDGRQFGPVTSEQLHGWYEEGRITADCQLLRKGGSQWQWATDLYPELQTAPPQLDPSQVTPQARQAAPRPATPRAAPAPSATPLTPLDPSDFPTAGQGLKALGPVIRPLPPGYQEPRYHSAEAMENRRKFAPFMVARLNRPPLHKMVLLVSILNFIFGMLRAGGYAVVFFNAILAIGILGENPDPQNSARAVAALSISFVMLALNITMIAGGIGLLQQQEWGRTATMFAALVGLLIQLTCVCVTMMLGAEASGLVRWVWIVLLASLLPSIAYDAFAAGVLSIPKVVADLED